MNNGLKSRNKQNKYWPEGGNSLVNSCATGNTDRLL